MRLLICAGGTGGGVYPALAVLQAEKNKDIEVLWVGSDDGLEADLVKRAGIEFKGIPAQLQTGNGLKFRAIDTSAGADVQVGPAGPFDAVTWTKNGTAYMMAFGEKKDVNVFISIMENI